MKIVKRYKGWTIKQPNKKERAEGMTYEYYLFTPHEEDYAEWECDSIEECIEWIDNY